jgi:hypothetical protein
MYWMDDLHNYRLKLVVYVRSKKGEFVLPTSLFVKFGDFEEMVTKNMTIDEEKKVLLAETSRSIIKYSGLHIGVEQSPEAQKAVVRLKTMEVNLDIPQSNVMFVLQPISFFDSQVVKLMNINTDPFENFSLVFSRSPNSTSQNSHTSDVHSLI